MRGSLAIMLALSACATASEREPAAFNLECVGTMTSSDTDFPFRSTEPSRTVLRVDLDARRYCIEPCTVSFPIAAVTDDEILFNDVPEGSGTNGAFVARMDRRTGRYSSYWRFYSIVDEVEANCTRTAPAPLPPPQEPQPPAAR